MNLSYPYTTTPQDGGGFFVQFVDLEEAITEGDTLDDAAFNAAEVLTAILSYRLDHGQTIPAPSAPAGRAVATPDAKTQAVMLLRDAVAGCCCGMRVATAPWPIWRVAWAPRGQRPNGLKTRITGPASNSLIAPPVFWVNDWF